MKGILKAMDGQPITPRTGVSEIEGSFSSLPNHPDVWLFTYLPGISKESPGVAIYPENIESIGNEYRFIDYHRRSFILTITENE